MSKELPRLLEEGRVEVRLDSNGTHVLTLASIGSLMDHLTQAAKLLGHDCHAESFTAGRALGRREMGPYKVALDAATEFINSHVADPDITGEMAWNYSTYLAAIEAIPEEVQQPPQLHES